MNGNLISSGLVGLALLLSSAIPACAESDTTMLEIGTELDVSATVGVQSQMTLVTLPGSYVELSLESAGVPVDLLLETHDGHHVRRLIKDATTRQVARFVADLDSYALRLVSENEAASAQITILRNLPSGELLDQPQMRVSYDPISPTLQNLLAAEHLGEDVQEFWQARIADGTPLVETDPEGDPSKRLVTFLWRGASQNARIVGAPADDHIWFERLGQTDIWFASFRTGRDLRMSYQIAPDIPLVPGSERERRIALLSTLQRDPLNPRVFGSDAMDRFEAKSYLALPGAVPQPGLDDADVSPPLEMTWFESAALGNKRRIWYYKPADFDPSDPENVVLFVYDGLRYTGVAPVPSILENLQKQGRLPPTAAIFIDSLDSDTRWRELSCNDTFLDVLANDLLPESLAYFGLEAHAERTVIAGSSLGGLSSACLALRHPDKFGNFISMSGSYWWAPSDYSDKAYPYVPTLLDDEKHKSLNAFISAGRYETSRTPDEIGIFGGSYLLAKALQNMGENRVQWQAYEGGHDYAIWRGAIADGLLHLFGE